MTDVTDVALGASDLWLGTRTGAGGTATLVCFFGRSPWLHGQQVNGFYGMVWSYEKDGREETTKEGV